MTRRYKELIIALAVLSLTSACLRVKYPEPGRPVGTSEGEALAFGRIAVIDRGHEIEPWRSDLQDALFAAEKPEIKLSLFLVESNRRAIYVRVESDGSFYWVLPPGTYLLYHSPAPAGRQPSNEPLAAFQVPPKARTVYVGTMAMHIESTYKKDTDRQDYEVTTVEIGDEYETARQMLAGRYPDLSGPSERRLMIHDPELRDLFRDYSKSRCEKVLNRNGISLLGQGAAQNN